MRERRQKTTYRADYLARVVDDGDGLVERHLLEGLLARELIPTWTLAGSRVLSLDPRR